MSDRESPRPDLAALLAPLLREWSDLRERERDLLRRFAETLEQLAAERARAAMSVAEASPAVPTPPIDSEALPSPPVSAAPSDPGVDPSWIDRTIDAALAGAFSGDDEDEPIDLPAVDLLLLRSGETWVGMLWEKVAGLGLSEDTHLATAPPPLSLGHLLGIHDGQTHAMEMDEPYRLTWDTPHGPRILACEVLGGVVAAPTAVARGVDLIWLPDASEVGGRLLPLVEFFARGGRGEKTEVIPESSPRESPSGPKANPPPPAVPPATPPVPQPVRPGLVPDTVAPPRVPSMSIPDAEASTQVSSVSTPVTVPPPPVPPRSTPDVVSPLPVEPPAGEVSWRPEPEHPDASRAARNISRSALVSVRYLPARVAIARALRGHGWFVLEAADILELPGMLQRVHPNALFTEAPERPGAGWLEALERARNGGTRVVSVASRLRGVAGDPLNALGEIPRLFYPFQETELERLIESPAQTGHL